MRFIPTRLHGAMDYLVGAILIAAPWLFDFAYGGSETWVPVLVGAGAITYSLFTDYELGAIKTLPMRTHLGLDAASGGLLLVSPWLFGFAEAVWAPHVVVGVLELGLAMTTEKVPAYGVDVRQRSNMQR